VSAMAMGAEDAMPVGENDYIYFWDSKLVEKVLNWYAREVR
jgi:hypothetical protein